MVEGPTQIQDLIRMAARQLRAEFEEIKRSNPHYAERGAEAEVILRDCLNDHLPKRFAADTGLVVDDEGGISRQCDVLVYDASNSPIYRRGKRVLILPSDNVAAILEVKSRLSKQELLDAAKKVGSVKALKRPPVSGVDQPVTMSPLITTRPLGVVFAYEATTTLDALAENLREINAAYSSDQWIDLVVVLDKGVIGYSVQMMFSPELSGMLGGPASRLWTASARAPTCSNMSTTRSETGRWNRSATTSWAPCTTRRTSSRPARWAAPSSGMEH